MDVVEQFWHIFPLCACTYVVICCKNGLHKINLMRALSYNSWRQNRNNLKIILIMPVIWSCGETSLKMQHCYRKLIGVFPTPVPQGSYRPWKVLEIDLHPGKTPGILKKYKLSLNFPGILKKLLDNHKKALKMIETVIPWIFLDAVCKKIKRMAKLMIENKVFWKRRFQIQSVVG